MAFQQADQSGASRRTPKCKHLLLSTRPPLGKASLPTVMTDLPPPELTTPLYKTKTPTTTTRQALRNGISTVAVGGDGTLARLLKDSSNSTVISTLSRGRQPEKPLCYPPAGTGDDFPDFPVAERCCRSSSTRLSRIVAEQPLFVSSMCSMDAVMGSRSHSFVSTLQRWAWR